MLRYYHYRNLSDRGRAAYKKAVAAIKAHRPYVIMERTGNPKAVLDAVKDDNPHFFFVNWYAILSRVNFRRNEIVIHINYLMERDEAIGLWQKAKELAASLSASTELGTVKRVHDYIAAHTKYNPRVKAEGVFRAADHHMIGALFERVAVCEGIARAAQFLLRELRVECTYQSGFVKAEGVSGYHAWNLVSVNGRLKRMDVTWDLPQGGGPISYKYFCTDC